MKLSIGSQNSIAPLAGYVPQIAVSFGEGNPLLISRDQTLPVKGGGLSQAEQVAREGTQMTNSYVCCDNSLPTYSIGQTLGYFSPSISRASSIESITVSATQDVAIWI